ncbi:putative uncharacterized alpha/beta hydrolase domain (DUF2235) [Lyophyllum shimeji]|uniref:Uncharacterized alpha/beta hydrolase domain (DUF2235) n=1 Tax=Lyophyllum shimeji TaxID=47721 RepID=A0A9P3PHY8_LYOSH|nr:putative uncharacterized alpha/beta hydrolase domain (DUF2235) [Lyophyllum shimeji]
MLEIKVPKRIVICCDGTWQDGIAIEGRSVYTNILRLARTIHHEDGRFKPAIPQIVFYQSGIGSDKNLYSRYVEGTTGGSLGDKVEEAYGFIAHNYHPGDEIFLFGFSRGAYTARMVAMFIGEIGILSRKDMDHFASIFVTYQKLGKCEDANEAEILKQKVTSWTRHDSPGKIRAESGQTMFSVKCLGVFDTVGSLGLPEEVACRSNEVRTIFGFPDKLLGAHVERAYQALALNETRADFNCAKFEQTVLGRERKQTLKQCWFSGSHADIGGGYPDHDLSDLTLTWMAAQIGDILSLDMKYLASLFHPVAPWGKLRPHDPATGIFVLAHTIQRPLPTFPNDVAHETIHASVLEQSTLSPELANVIAKHPELVHPLLPLEEEVKLNWPLHR